ncbi:unnamed protein product, partial [Rotaria sp. Silwood1]
MFSERWLCFCCPQTHKPTRRPMVAPIEQPETPPEIRPPSQMNRIINRPKQKSEIHLAAVVIIQTWFRRRRALFEMRRKAAWTIYQHIEYAGEQNQLKLYNFFLELMQTVAKNPRDVTVAAKSIIDIIRSKNTNNILLINTIY